MLINNLFYKKSIQYIITFNVNKIFIISSFLKKQLKIIETAPYFFGFCHFGIILFILLFILEFYFSLDFYILDGQLVGLVYKKLLAEEIQQLLKALEPVLGKLASPEFIEDLNSKDLKIKELTLELLQLNNEKYAVLLELDEKIKQLELLQHYTDNSIASNKLMEKGFRLLFQRIDRLETNQTELLKIIARQNARNAEPSVSNESFFNRFFNTKG